MRSLIAAAIVVAALTDAAFAQGTQSFDRVERGRYLAILGDCEACHNKPGGQPFAGGLALQTPFGTLVAPNITPDRETGIGNWTDGEFIAALHDGRGHNGTRLYPAMPYPAFTRMTDDDVLALRAYFATLAPVSNKVISNQLPFPLNIRLAMVLERAEFHPGPLPVQSGQIGGMESRRLYCRGRGALRHLSHPEDGPRRRPNRDSFDRRNAPGMVRT